jgi:hypothetical protein
LVIVLLSRRVGVSHVGDSSLAVTTVSLRHLEGQEDLTGREVAEAIGVSEEGKRKRAPVT